VSWAEVTSHRGHTYAEEDTQGGAIISKDQMQQNANIRNRVPGVNFKYKKSPDTEGGSSTLFKKQVCAVLVQLSSSSSLSCENIFKKSFF
jgi:hypothetical protein